MLYNLASGTGRLGKEKIMGRLQLTFWTTLLLLCLAGLPAHGQSNGEDGLLVTEAIDPQLKTSQQIGVRPSLNNVDPLSNGWGWWWFSHIEYHDQKWHCTAATCLLEPMNMTIMCEPLSPVDTM